MQNQLPVFTDASTTMQAAQLNTAATAQSCLLSGSIPTSSGSLTLSLPALAYIYNDGASAQACAASSQTLAITGGASSTTYVYINKAGALAQNTTGTPPANYVLLCVCLVNAGNTALTTITPVMTAFGLGVATVGGDYTEAASADALAAGMSLKNTLNRIRKAITNITGGSFPSAVSGVVLGFMAKDGSNATTPAFPGAISTAGLATLDSAAVTGDLAVGGDETVTGHRVSGGSAPTSSIVSAPTTSSGSSATIIAGNDTAGQLQMAWTGGTNNTATGIQAEVLFDTAYGTPPKAVICTFASGTSGFKTSAQDFSPGVFDAISPTLVITAITSTYFRVACNFTIAGGGGGALEIYYAVMG